MEGVAQYNAVKVDTSGNYSIILYFANMLHQIVPQLIIWLLKDSSGLFLYITYLTVREGINMGEKFGCKCFDMC